MKYILCVSFLLLSFSLQAQKKWTVEDCINYANDHNLNLTNSRKNEEILQNQAQITKNQKLPGVNGNFNNSVNFGFQRTLSGLYEFTQSYANNWGIDANVLLYNRGNLKIQREKANLNTQIQEYNSDIIVQNMSLQIANLYLSILLNKELVKVAEKQYNNTLNQLDKIEKLYTAGSVPYSNLVEQESRAASDNNQVENAKINVDRAQFQLAIFLQLDDYEAFDVANVNIPSEIVSEDLDVKDVVDYALENRPELKQAELQVEAADKDILLAKTNLWPSITGGYTLGTNYFNFFNQRDNGLFKQWWDNQNQQLYLGISIPIFNKNNSKLNIVGAELNKELISQNIEQQKLTLTQDIQTAYFDAQAAYQTYVNNKTTYEAAVISESYAQKSYDAGKTSIYDYNNLKTNTLVAEINMVRAKYDYFFRVKVLDFYAGKTITLDYTDLP